MSISAVVSRFRVFGTVRLEIIKFAKALTEQQSTRVLLFEMCHMGQRKDGDAIAA
jgi:hypothetical protein